ncbi:MAG: hypothetical protein ACTHM6_13880, partial [Tepidisphaeraceae bacterium]
RSAIAESEIVHAFGARALATAVLARAVAIVYTPTHWPNRAAIAWLRAAMAYRSIDIACENDTLRRALVTRGVSADRCHLVRPGVSLGGMSATRNEALRARLGLSPDDHAILAPLPVGMGGDPHLAVWSISLLNVLDPRYKLIVPGAGNDRGVFGRIRERLLERGLLVIASERAADVESRTLYSAADAVLLTPTAHARSADIVTVMASMRPIISTVTSQICEFIEDRHTALLARQATPRMVARRILDGFADPTLLRSVADRARVEAYEHFTISKMLANLDDVYAKAYSNTAPIRSNPMPAPMPA